MAKGRSPRVSGGAAAQPSERDRIIDAALSLIAQQGWRRLSLAAIVAVKLTAAAYLATSRVWLRDDSPDLAPTMAALDRRLRGIERWFSGGRRPQPDATASRV